MAFLVYDRCLSTLKTLKPLLDQVRRHDRSLADQMQRAAQSTFLNIAEAQSARGKNKAAKLQVALGESREARAALRLSVAWGYVRESDSATVDDALDQLAAMLWVLMHRPSRCA